MLNKSTLTRSTGRGVVSKLKLSCYYMLCVWSNLQHKSDNCNECTKLTFPTEERRYEDTQSGSKVLTFHIWISEVSCYVRERTDSSGPPWLCVMQLDVLWYFLSSISLGARFSGIPGRWWCGVGLSLPLICSHTADSQGACHRGRGERGLKCSARYSKRCLINNVSDRTRWDTAGLLCLSQVHTHTHTCTHLGRDWSSLTPTPPLQKPPPDDPLNIQI